MKNKLGLGVHKSQSVQCKASKKEDKATKYRSVQEFDIILFQAVNFEFIAEKDLFGLVWIDGLNNLGLVLNSHFGIF